MVAIKGHKTRGAHTRERGAPSSQTRSDGGKAGCAGALSRPANLFSLRRDRTFPDRAQVAARDSDACLSCVPSRLSASSEAPAFDSEEPDAVGATRVQVALQ